MSLSASRVGGLFALAASLLLATTFPLIFLGRPDAPPPFSPDPVKVLTSLTKAQLPFWTLLHTLYGAFFFLLLPALWALHRRLREQAPAEATAGLTAGGIALVSEGLGRLWHATVETTLARLLLATDHPEARTALLEVARRLDPFHQALHLASFLILVWALLTAYIVIRHRGVLPLWAGLLSFLLVPALGPFPWAALPWLVPVGLLLWQGGGAAQPLPRALARSRR